MASDIEIVELPPCPPDFVCHAQGDLESPKRFFPNRRPASAYYVAGVEWSPAPAHMRGDAYHLSSDRHRQYWFLWLATGSEWDETGGEGVWAWALRGKVPPEVAAVHLLTAAWKYEASGPRRPFFRVTGEGLLSEADIEAIAREVWPGS
jgi:hypothetical protein